MTNHRGILVYNELFTFLDANAHEIIQSPEEFLHFWICFDVDAVSTYKNIDKIRIILWLCINFIIIFT